ncbi:AAA family ATPase [Actinoplanes sp. NPDC020271]|uniref:adenylate/guanylate cyclase domain-containing protein n=1 Tax=Actinoplanes sp. NPDC020271 TaxID=3363896 RepID=UPI0037B87356
MSRRLVVVLFLDLVGWTRLAERVDPEPLQRMLEQYYEICSTAVEECGGTVEKFIGDAIMAAFGASRSREDDALRALRAAERIRAETSRLAAPGGPAPRVHCGVAAGEALVTWSSRAGLRVVGDVVNLAARLQSVATADEIIVNEVVARLSRSHYELHRLAPLALKGKAEPVPAWRVGAALATRADDTPPLVDREDERARLRAAYETVAGTGRGRVIAVLGPPGAGKTRLVRHALTEWGDAPAAAVGTCPSYGPEANAVALGEVLAALTGPGGPARELVAATPRLATVLAGLADGRAARPPVEEVAWAARTVLAAAAAARPLVVVWDGFEWAGPSLRRLIGRLTVELADLPVLTVLAGRPSSADAEYAGPAADEVIAVTGLGPADSARLAALLGAEVVAHTMDLVERVTRHSAGNPLFIRLMVEAAGTGDEVPPTVTALVGAVVDQLPDAARETLGRAAVLGSTFTGRHLALLGDPEPGALETLVARHLIRAGETGEEFLFVQQPVHEVVYGRLEKEQRLAWHHRLAEAGVSPGFHLEAAVRLLGDLRPGDPQRDVLAAAGARALLEEGTAQLRRRDIPVAIGLLERAVRLAVGPPRSVAAIRLSDALLLAGDTHRAVRVVAELASQTTDACERRRCLIQRLLVGARLGDGAAPPELGALMSGRELVAGGDDRLARCRADQVRLLRHLSRGRFGAAERAARSALRHARALGDAYEEDRLLAALCEVRQWAPTPIAEQLAGCAELADRFAADRFLLIPVLVARARALALTGDEGGARAALGEAGAAARDLRLTMGSVLVDQAAGLVCALAGDHGAAEQRYRRAAAVVEQAGHRSIALALRASAVRERARLRPADAPAELAELLSRIEEMDVRGRLVSLATAVRSGAARGRPGPAAALTELLARTDDPCLRGEVHVDLAYAARVLGREPEALAHADAAIACFETIGATCPAEAVRRWR